MLNHSSAELCLAMWYKKTVQKAGFLNNVVLGIDVSQFI